MKEKLSLLTELIKLAKCDNEVREQEYNFIHAIAEQLGVGKSDFDNLFTEYIDFTPPKSEFQRILQFHRLVLLMNIDKETHDKELTLIRDLGIKMGLSPMATEQVLSEMEQYPNKVVPPDRLTEIYKSQFN